MYGLEHEFSRVIKSPIGLICNHIETSYSMSDIQIGNDYSLWSDDSSPATSAMEMNVTPTLVTSVLALLSIDLYRICPSQK